MNICGCLVQTDPKQTDTTIARIGRMEGAEIHARDPSGRLVVVVEDTPGMRAEELILALHQLPGVIALTLSYHHFEPTEDSAVA